MKTQYLLNIPFRTNEHGEILIKEDDNTPFKIDGNNIKLNETKRKGNFEVLIKIKIHMDFYKNLKNTVNT